MAGTTKTKPTTENKEKAEIQGPAPDPTQALSAAIDMFDEEFSTLNLFGKIATISGFIGRVPKNGYNKFNDYRYVLESDLVEHIRYWLSAARILIYPTVKEHTLITFERVAGERQRDHITEVLYTFRVVDGRTGEVFELDALGQGADPRDKGSNKASTSAMKFAYLRLFNISSGEDAEGDSAGDQRQAEGGVQPVTVTPGIPPEDVQRGGKTANATGTQIKAISNLSNQLQLGAVGLVGVIKRVLGDDIDLGDDETKHGPIIANYLKAKTGEEAGKVIQTLQDMTKAVPGGEEVGGGYEG